MFFLLIFGISAGGMSHRDLEDGSDHEDYDITLD